MPRKVNKYLVKEFPEIHDFFDKEKNTLDLETLKYKSGKSLYLLCPKCGHSFSKSIVCISKYGIKCKKCNSFGMTCAELMKDWNYSENANIDPFTLAHRTNLKVEWKCHVCGYCWSASISNRNHGSRSTGCPYCNGKVLTKYNSFAYVYPALSKQWDYDRNKKGPEEYTHHSGQRVWWLCEKGHSWKALISNRANGRGCPVCSNKKVVEGINSLYDLRPDIVIDWHYEKNGNILPTQVSKNSGKKVGWKCHTCEHEWKSTIDNRVRDRGCPACGNKTVTDFNNLKVLFPLVALDWNYEENDFKPEDIVPGSNKQVSWKCKDCGYKWRAMANTRTYRDCGCSHCSRGRVSKVSQQWLDAIGIEVREYYIKDLKYRVDGFDPKTNTVYEFLGDYWHGNPERFNPEDFNKTSKKFFGQLYKETFNRINKIEEAGYKVVYIWENDYYKLIREENENQQ